MTPRFRFGHPLPKEFRRLAGELAGAALSALTEGDVHQTRRRIKEIRALFALTLKDADAPQMAACFRDIARAISQARDDEVCLATLNRLEALPPTPGQDVFPAARAALHRNRASTPDPVRHVAELQAACKMVDGWRPIVKPGHLRKALRKSYCQCRKALAVAGGEAGSPAAEEALHTLRKRIKRLWAQLRLIHTPGTGKRIRRADEIAEAIGLEHDLAVLNARLRGTPAGKALERKIESERAHLRRIAMERASRLLRTTPGKFLKKIGVEKIR